VQKLQEAEHGVKRREIWESVCVHGGEISVIQYQCDHLTGIYVKGFRSEFDTSPESALSLLNRLRGFRNSHSRLSIIAVDVVGVVLALDRLLADCSPPTSLKEVDVGFYDIMSYASAVLETEAALLRADYDGLVRESRMKGLVDHDEAPFAGQMADRQAQFFCNLHARTHGYVLPFAY